MYATFSLIGLTGHNSLKGWEVALPCSHQAKEKVEAAKSFIMHNRKWSGVMLDTEKVFGKYVLPIDEVREWEGKMSPIEQTLLFLKKPYNFSCPPCDVLPHRSQVSRLTSLTMTWKCRSVCADKPPPQPGSISHFFDRKGEIKEKKRDNAEQCCCRTVYLNGSKITLRRRQNKS